MLKDVEPPAGADSPIGAADWFVGYLLLDAIILNSDRHHENWAVLQRSDGSRQLAPSYDHASSLGRELKDSERSARLTGKDPRHTVETYVARARSTLYGDPSDARPLHPADAFLRALELQPSAADHWLDKVKTLSLDAFTTLVDRVPPELMSDPARAFGVDVVQESLALLLRRLRSET